jgi:hypothetical protein
LCFTRGLKSNQGDPCDDVEDSDNAGARFGE